jgi:hypothetical protein
MAQWLLMAGPLRSDEVDRREWVSFEHAGETWMFDVSFLTSNWRCIWNDGCLGIHPTPTPELVEGCCSLGAHFSDDADRERVRAAAERLTPEDWQHADRLEAVFVQDDTGGWQTSVSQGSCIFFNQPDFDGGPGCALHRGALRTGAPITDWKPEVCWQVPLRLEYHHDESGHTVNVLRPWHRRDWGEGGDDFGWWCTDDDRAFVGQIAAYEELRHEIGRLVGDEVASMLREHLDRTTALRVHSEPADP